MLNFTIKFFDNSNIDYYHSNLEIRTSAAGFSKEFPKDGTIRTL
ncbi:hypothetical protein LEP1GSC083_3206 [Leptospira interrogans serovar Pyrogenes str. L0374]|uniref:Uncharacterized protein n=2 Tax=Leptospira interrogans serovar Pyrogenes TaxID=280500 RepID=M6ZKE3_LEPIR|nr:hypothetical protein LEP1GSC083_3206 [Leptospira interrogans serovar Pyrogenes str. L0374]EMP06943.1 hypothetical protein LEP1GSC124_3350 [Leptospira interrogans serovar Pyrogenes str. 200701872]